MKKSLIVWIAIGIVAGFTTLLMEFFRGMGIWLIPNLLLFPLAMLFLSGVAIVSIPVVLFLLFRKKSTTPRSRAIFTAIVFGVFALVPFWGGLFADPYLLGYFVSIKSDLPALRDWSQSVLNEKHEAGADLKPTLPEKLNHFRFVNYVRLENSSEPHIKFASGGHFVGFWGLRIGRDSLRLPTNRFQTKIAPGIYVWMQDEFDYTVKN